MAALLVSDYGEDIGAWHRELGGRVPELDLRMWPSVGDTREIEIIFIDTLMAAKGGFFDFSRLRWVSYLGHGVGDVLRDPSLPADVIVTRMHDRGIARSLAIFALQAVTRHHLRAHDYAAQQRDQIWRRLGAPAPTEVRVAVLGLGVIGLRIAAAFASMDYRVAGWSRTPKTVDGIATVHGRSALTPLLRDSDFVVAALPETDATVGLLNRTTFAAMKQGSVIVNVGRGSLIVEEDLLDTLNSGHLGGAVLDVSRVEPLPVGHPLWTHPKVHITPHSGGPSSGSGTTLFDDLAANYARLRTGEPLYGVAERERGY